MTAPNIVNVATITGKTAVLKSSDLTDNTATSIVTNSASSNKVFKVNALLISNIDGTANVAISVSILRSSNSYFIASTITVPADATLDLISKAIYLEEGDALQITPAVAADVNAVCSYEEIS
mgnify:CR=1 FL=1